MPKSRAVIGSVAVALLLMAGRASAQTLPAQPEVVKGGYAIHQTADLGGHIAAVNGSRSMYATLINIHSGPRVLGETFEMHAMPDSKHFGFDSLSAASGGFGGDPTNYATLNFSKGKIYEFHGMFRRDRQYFDYNLHGNPLIPSGVVSNGYTFPQVLDSPHLFNSVRRMTDTEVTIFPLSMVTFRVGYSQNIMQGPSFSSIHTGTEGLLLQNWRNSTDSWTGAIDWKPLPQTRLTFEEYVDHYKGDTSWQMAPSSLNLQLANGTPVSLGFDNVTAPGNSSGSSVCGARPPILSNATTPPTANPCVNGYLQYSRYQPTRTLFPTEEFRFQSSSLKSLEMNGRIRYTGASMKLPQYQEFFNGLQSRGGLRAYNVTGSASAQRIDVTADYGVVWRVTDAISLSDQYDFSYFRQPARDSFSELDQLGTSLLAAPGPPGAPVLTNDSSYLGQKTATNTLMAAWQASPLVSLSLGYRYRSKTIDRTLNGFTDVFPTGTSYELKIHENGGLLGVDLRPSRRLTINGNVEATYADLAYVQTSPRALQHYKVRASYKPRDWATVSAAFNDLERRNNVTLVNHLDHSRSFTFGATIAPGEHYGLDLNYGYTDVFERTTLCYDSSIPGTPIPTGTGCGSNIYLSNFFYDAPTEYGSIGMTFTPIRTLRSSVGYRMSAVNGGTVYLNPRQVPGSLQSQYQSPYATVAWTVHPGWVWKGEWNYYGYGEGSPVGPTSGRSFHGDVYTIAMHYEF